MQPRRTGRQRVNASERQARLAELRRTMSQKHLMVCHLLLQGATQQDAWMSVYTRVKKLGTASENCRQMLKNTENGAAEYIEHTKWLASATATERLGIDSFYVLQGLKSVAERCMQAEPVMEKNADGELEPTGEYTFAYQGANKAFELMGKELGMFKSQVEIGTTDEISDILRDIGERNAKRSLLPSGL